MSSKYENRGLGNRALIGRGRCGAYPRQLRALRALAGGYGGGALSGAEGRRVRIVL